LNWGRGGPEGLSNFFGVRLRRWVQLSQQIWCSVATYVLITIVKKNLQLGASLYTCLQILSVSIFQKTEISCALQPDRSQREIVSSANRLILFDF
jgi:hypothetical protein